MIKIVKKIIIASMLCSVLLMMSCSCNQSVRIEGFDNYDKADSSSGLVARFLPYFDGDTTFMEMYEYKNGNYYYVRTTEYYVEEMERALIFLEYEPAVYEEAKEYCLANMENLSEKNVFEYNGYEFTENLAISDTYIEDGVNTMFPQDFKMFVYNDSKCTLVFIGFYAFMPYYEDAVKLAEDDWGAFLEEYYGEFYSFE